MYIVCTWSRSHFGSKQHTSVPQSTALFSTPSRSFGKLRLASKFSDVTRLTRILSGDEVRMATRRTARHCPVELTGPAMQNTWVFMKNRNENTQNRMRVLIDHTLGDMRREAGVR